MRLPKIAIENYQFVVVLIFMILSTGLISFFNMPRSEDPQLKFPGYTVLTVYPGTSPKDMEELIVDPLEEAIKEVEDITDVNTRIEDGIAVIQIDAEFDVDVDDKYDEIVAQVSSVEQELPEGILNLEVTKVSPQEVKILQLAYYLFYILPFLFKLLLQELKPLLMFQNTRFIVAFNLFLG